jgi:hypothetical protein
MTTRWFTVITQAMSYERKKNQRGEPIAFSAELRDVIGTDHLLVVRVVNSQRKKVKMGLRMLGFSSESALWLGVAVLDVRSGEILWKDEEYLPLDPGTALNEKQVSWIVSKVLKRMP